MTKAELVFKAQKIFDETGIVVKGMFDSKDMTEVTEKEIADYLAL